MRETEGDPHQKTGPPRGGRLGRLSWDDASSQPPSVVLLLGGDETEAAGIRRALCGARNALRVEFEPLPDRFRDALHRHCPNLVLALHRPPENDGLQTLLKVQHEWRCETGIPVVVVAVVDCVGDSGEDMAGELLGAGACDYIPLRALNRLAHAVDRALEHTRLLEELARSRAELQNCNLALERVLRDHALELFLKSELLEDELRLSEKIHCALQPEHIPPLLVPCPEATEPARCRTVRFAGFYRPASVVGGDFFHVSRISDSAVNILMCDVMGHGPRAALVSAMLRSLDQNLAEKLPDPARLLGSMNRVLCTLSQHCDSPVFATACAITLDLKTATLQLANAGQPRPLRIPSGGMEPSSLGTTGASNPALGIFPNASYQSCSEVLNEGDSLLLFTDGIFLVESAPGIPLTPEWLRAEVRDRSGLPAQALVDAIAALLEGMRGFTQRDDDLCLLAVQLGEQPEAGGRGRESKSFTPAHTTRV